MQLHVHAHPEPVRARGAAWALPPYDTVMRKMPGGLVCGHSGITSSPCMCVGLHAPAAGSQASQTTAPCLRVQCVTRARMLPPCAGEHPGQLRLPDRGPHGDQRRPGALLHADLAGRAAWRGHHQRPGWPGQRAHAPPTPHRSPLHTHSIQHWPCLLGSTKQRDPSPKVAGPFCRGPYREPKDSLFLRRGDMWQDEPIHPVVNTDNGGYLPVKGCCVAMTIPLGAMIIVALGAVARPAPSSAGWCTLR